MTLYWKVHINSFDDFVAYVLSEYKYFLNRDLHHFKEYYRNFTYLYFFIDEPTNLSYNGFYLSYLNEDDMNMTTEDKNSNWKYMGNFNSRKKKLEKLDIISSENIE